MLKPLILQTAESLRISLNDPLMRWLRGSDQITACTAKVATQGEWCATLERITRMPPVPGDPSMLMLAKAALLSAAAAELEASIQHEVRDIDIDAAPPAYLRDQILRECARAWVYAERESPATHRFIVRLQTMEDALRVQCGLAGGFSPPAEPDQSPFLKIA